MKRLSILFLFGIYLISCTESPKNITLNEIKNRIDQGKYTETEKIIKQELKDNRMVAEHTKRELKFELERMRRIRKDFTKSRKEVVDFIRSYIPDVTDNDIEQWEREKKLEYMVIDGKKRYFNHAARNLFRLDKAAQKIWMEKNPQPNKQSAKDSFDLDEHDRSIMKAASIKHGYVIPKRFRIHYTITVDSDAVPAGQTVRCWIPFPREIDGRQTDLKILDTDPKQFILAPKTNLQRTIYFEKIAHKAQPIRFSVNYEFTNRGIYVAIDPERVQRVTARDSLQEYLKEEPPHIVFNDSIKNLSRRILGDEKNPYRMAQKLFAWVDRHIIWASAREYSTIRDLSLYPIINHHGDCGIQTMLFITLCRYNGIPARWQSGWEFKPPSDSMHDWGMIYFKPYGWMPVDVTYGLRNSGDENFKYFYLQGMDSYRLIFNDGFAQRFAPPKKYIRSETVDSQRGEVEWDGGNLYFDRWQWDMQWEVLK